MRTAAPSPERQLAWTTATIATVGALAWIALATDSLLRPEPRDYRDALFLVPWALYAATLAGVHRLQRHGSRSLEHWAFRVVTATAVLVAVGSVGHVVGAEALEVLSFPIGALVWTLGMIAFGVGTARTALFPRRVGWAIALSQPLTIAISTVAFSILAEEPDGWGSYPGVIGHAAVMLVLIAALRDPSTCQEAVQPREATAPTSAPPLLNEEPPNAGSFCSGPSAAN